MTNIAIFASGNGSNAVKIIEYFRYHSTIKIAWLGTNNPQAGVIQQAKDFGVSCDIFTKNDLNVGNEVKKTLTRYNIHYIILAGFLLKIPQWLIADFPNKILNIHPSLLPKYGGKNMYGMHVHHAVKANHETTSGMTVHIVNAEYDQGKILFQAKTSIASDYSAEDIAHKVLALEHKYFATVIENYILGKV